MGLLSSDEVENHYTTLIKPWNNRCLTEFPSIDVIQNTDLKKLSFASRVLTEQIVKLFNVKNSQPGDDHYYAKSFSQGSVYYFGLGIFYEHSGEDQYNALSHSQEYAAHYALAGFMDD